MNARRQRPLSRPLPRRLLGAVLLALLFAQWAALAHAVAHGPQLIAASQNAGLGATNPDGDTAWTHAAGSSPCQLVDHLLIGQATGSDAPALPLARLEAAAPACLPSAAVARLALAAYEARGPPRA